MVKLNLLQRTGISNYSVLLEFAALFILAFPAAVAGSDYVGGSACIQCHQDNGGKWKNSHHALAMQHANADIVRGDFDDREYTYNNITTRFYKKDNKFYVRTDGPDGKLFDYEIKYTFGYEPLQQYLIEFPGGRLQALGIAWDTRPKDEGGQRWFHLYPQDKIDHKDPLHWTGPQQNWNYMCAECHSTELKKGYDRSKRIYNTQWAEINVSCEACHGPGKDHVAWAAKPNKDLKDKGLHVTFPETGPELWSIAAETGNAVRKGPLNNRAEVETCGRCHARRGALTDNYIFNRPLLDTHRVALLEGSLYHADGQIDEEVYVYGSFLQSKMYAKGVSCSDCHDPHTSQLRAPGHAVCLTCHSKNKYESKTHHFHEMGSRGSSCVECHMPAKNYMIVDPRHDHSFRIPRPDLSLQYGTPNACTNCHTDKDDQWAVQLVQKWYGEKLASRDSYAKALHAARSGGADAGELLLKTIQDPQMPDIVRATAVSLLPRYMSPAAIHALNSALYDKDALTRMAAVRALEAVAPQARLALVAPLLDDPVRSVRIEAARLLAPVPEQVMNEMQRQAFDKAFAEYITVQQFNADRPESHLNLGLLYAQRGDPAQAEASYQTAIDIDPGFIPAYVNLADLYRAQQRDSDAESTLRAALSRQPEQADVHHSLGLLLIRSKLMNEALQHLREAAQLAPDNARYSYVYAIALHSKGDRKAALTVLEQAFTKHPTDRNILMSLITINQEIGNTQQARQHLNALRKLSPNDPRLRELERALDGS